ncbi:MAG: coenzyme F420-0:L-glutamate ligase [Candidatus Dadabacteria bacterium]|nr:coenzyme F420-0:L-glutamate ligase [Candidatus Dadabacteria bacterium]
MKATQEIRLVPLKGIPEVKEGDNIGELILAAASHTGFSFLDGDIAVVAQKVVSKAEGRVVRLSGVNPSDFAVTVAQEVSKDPRLVEVILGETRRIVRMDERVHGKGRLIVETEEGLVLANAGVDASNVSGGEDVTLLPVDSDRSAGVIRNHLKEKTGRDVAVIISDTVGRPFREGLTDIAIGCSGMKALSDRRGETDSKGLELVATEMATADQVACAAGLLMEKTSAVPVVIVRGADYIRGEGDSGDLVRDPACDLFR